ncbi:PAS domain S-box protein [Nodosilinea sp. LEGE 06152]|uniref:PAS domain S-box protein n=1 Tax=Nodosilinea sp. LEGE 06152 TaxID=2777966 RepID=UPI00187EFA61|nr:PAS domain S-box protein [Nodosilinea sp. LEGE 06152]MBE9160422.1 PAS domain S-box protein [Nodosilinea sp. LEGE 06152]
MAKQWSDGLTAGAGLPLTWVLAMPLLLSGISALSLVTHLLQAHPSGNGEGLLWLALLALGWAIAQGLWLNRELLRCLRRVDGRSRDLAAGHLTTGLPSDSPVVEFNRLAHSFNQMAERVQASLGRLQANLSDAEHWLAQYSQLSPSMNYTYVEVTEGDASERQTWYEYLSAAVTEIGEISVEAGLRDANAVRGLIHPDDAAGYLAAEMACEQTLSTFSHQCRIVTPSGRVKWIHNQSQPLRRDDGTIAWHGVVVDISSYKQAEAALQESETRFRQLAEAVKEGFFVYETETAQYSYVNSAYWKIRGLTPDMTTNSEAEWLASIHPEDRDRVEAALVHERQGKHFDQEYRYTTPNGELRWLRSRAFPLCDDLGTVVRVVGTVEDITDRKLTEVALRQSEARFRNAFDNAPYGISLVAATGQFVLANAYYCALLGYSEAELLTITFKDITHPDDWADDWVGFQRMMGGKTATYQIEKRYITKQGEVIPVIINAAPIYDDGGKPLYSVGHVQDIRDRLAIDRMKDEFISVVSHELRTPITAIQGALALLGVGMYESRPEKARRMLEIAINNSDRLVRLVDDILSFERLESGQVQLEKELCQVAHLLYQAIDSVQPLADQSGITIALTPLTATLWAAPDSVIQVLTNLLSNAIKFSCPNGTVWVKASTERLDAADSNLSVLFTVQDYGRGIPPEKLEVIFDQFQQVDVSDSRQRGGTGLGLAICKRIVQQHRGQIWVESEVGRGSTFSVALPLVQGDSHD